MKTPFIALAFAVAATAATAQLAAPVAQDATAAPPQVHRPAHALLHADRERVKGDKERLRMARAAHDGDAVRAAEAALRNDMDAWHADRERLKH
ncbi:MAG: hypothetical protein ACJ8G1_03230 [Vitreoscilla sp.]